jgi:hypothetical protein
VDRWLTFFTNDATLINCLRLSQTTARFAQAEKFVASADLSRFDLSGFKPMKFDIDAHSKVPLTQTPAAPTRQQKS